MPHFMTFILNFTRQVIFLPDSFTNETSLILAQWLINTLIIKYKPLPQRRRILWVRWAKKRIVYK